MFEQPPGGATCLPRVVWQLRGQRSLAHNVPVVGVRDGQRAVRVLVSKGKGETWKFGNAAPVEIKAEGFSVEESGVISHG